LQSGKNTQKHEAKRRLEEMGKNLKAMGINFDPNNPTASLKEITKMDGALEETSELEFLEFTKELEEAGRADEASDVSQTVQNFHNKFFSNNFKGLKLRVTRALDAKMPPRRALKIAEDLAKDSHTLELQFGKLLMKRAKLANTEIKGWNHLNPFSYVRAGYNTLRNLDGFALEKEGVDAMWEFIDFKINAAHSQYLLEIAGDPEAMSQKLFNFEANDNEIAKIETTLKKKFGRTCPQGILRTVTAKYDILENETGELQFLPVRISKNGAGTIYGESLNEDEFLKAVETDLKSQNLITAP
jgi:hypothetical protein